MLLSDDARGPSRADAGGTATLRLLVVGVFFVWGGATSLEDILITRLKSLFALTYAEAMLSQLAFFTAYFVVAIPAGMLVSRIGYVSGLVVGLAVPSGAFS